MYFGCKSLTVRQKKILVTLPVWQDKTPVLQILYRNSKKLPSTVPGVTLGLREGHQSCRRSLQPSTENFQNFKKFISLVDLFSGVIFDHLEDPYPADKNQRGSMRVRSESTRLLGTVTWQWYVWLGVFISSVSNPDGS